MEDDLLASMIGDYLPDWPKTSGVFTTSRSVGTISDEMGALTASQLRQLQNRLTQHNTQPPVDWRARREHVAKFKETYVKLRADNIVLDHQTAIELAKVIYKESETITWEDTQ